VSSIEEDDAVTTRARAVDSRIHPTAIVDARAELAPDVEVGPYCIVGPGVRIDAGSRLVGHVVITGRSVIGRGNVFHPFVVIGGEPQVRKVEPEGAAQDAPGARVSSLVIGDENVFREQVTVNLSSCGAPTSIGAKNLFMAGAHVAHDVMVGSRCVVANGVQLAGHVVVEDWVTFGGLSGVAQHLRIGQSSFVAAGAMCERDVPPFVIVQGDRARVRALNVIGLERRGLSAESIAGLKKAFARTFVRGPSHSGFDDAVRALDRSDPFVAAFAHALSGAGRAPHG
jgi:UDP-N-acetylglucosamine acyltransferase